MSRKSSVLPIVAVLSGLALTGCEHPDGMALVTANATTTTIHATSLVDLVPTTTTAADPASTTGNATSTQDPTTTPPVPAPVPAPTPITPTTGRPPAAETPVKPPAPAPAAPVRTDVDLAEARVVELTNAERAAHGCPALAADDRLAAAARAHSADMAAQDYFDHVSKDGRSFADRVRAAGHPQPGAENIAAGQRTAASVVEGWMNSPGHRANILNCELRTLGAGMARGGSYGVYWTQNFGW